MKRSGYIKRKKPLKKYGGKTNNKQSYRKSLQNEAEKLWKLICRERDGLECQVQKAFPDVPIPHSSVMQVDHCFTRTNKDLFVDPSNGTVVCGNCNGAKGWGQKSVSRLIDQIVINREGFDKYERMKAADTHYVKSDNWQDIHWLEAKVTELKKMLEG